jgi:beta-lactamase class A
MLYNRRYMKSFLLITMVLLFLPAFSQKTDKKLEAAIRNAVQGYNGDIGIYVKNLRTGKTVLYNADTVFPTASIVKVPILVGIMHRIHTGELSYDSSFTYKDSLLYAGSDILGSFKNNEKIALKKLILLMLSTSDNTASLWLQSLAGTGTRINQLMDSLGLTYTRVNSRTPGRKTTVRNMAGARPLPLKWGNCLKRYTATGFFLPQPAKE